jgi:hypothetical protein
MGPPAENMTPGSYSCCPLLLPFAPRTAYPHNTPIYPPTYCVNTVNYTTVPCLNFVIVCGGGGLLILFLPFFAVKTYSTGYFLLLVKINLKENCR